MAPGTRLGRYEIIGELGTGGMAIVYEGRALSVGGFARRVAIKYLHPHLLRDEQFVQMFLDEGRLAAGIHHPNVVAVVDLVVEPHCMYMVSEYVEGDQLLALFKSARDAGARIPAPIAVRIALDLLAGLHAAHELAADDGTPLRIVHRDVSPHNVLVGADGITRITDFGIAKAEERISTTRDGIVKGKLSYMAPEQPDDLPVDRRADIFSAATVLWECLTSKRLFPGRSDREVLEGLLRKPIPTLRAVVPELPSSLDEVLVKALARDPDARYFTAAEFAEALEVGARPVGVATPREVARYVEQKAATKLGAERERRRAMTTKELPVYRAPGAEVSAVASLPKSPDAVRTEPGVGAPPRDPDDQPTMLSAPHLLKSLRKGDDFEDQTVVKTGTPAQPSVAAGSVSARAAADAPAASAPPVPLASPPRVEVVRPSSPDEARRPLLPMALLVLVLGSLLGYGVWFVLRPEAPRGTHVVIASPTPTATAARALEPVAERAPQPVVPVVVPEPVIAPPALAPLVAPPVEAPAPRVVRAPVAAPALPVVRPRAAPVARPVEAPDPPPREAAPTPAAPTGPRLPRHI